MAQINVHSETHKLVKELSYKTSKSIHQVAQEAFELYQQSMQSDNVLLDKFLAQVAETIVGAVQTYMREEVPVIVDHVRAQLSKAQTEEAKKAAQEAEQVIAAKGALPKPKTVHPTKKWLGGSESDDIQELIEKEEKHNEA